MKTGTLAIIISFLFIAVLTTPVNGQVEPDQIQIDDNGIMRWRKDSSEVTGFGINYTVPFAHAYRSGKKLGVNLKEAIDHDVYHFSRLALDLFRVHVWDTEISDTVGNLIRNEHLELFDYLLFKLNERGIKSIITPIAYWGNGWPEPDELTPGFSYKYGKDSSLVNPQAIDAQENYLKQFVQHVNPYNGIAYKDDPMILAFEISNEPHHRGTPAQVTSFIKKMKEAIRITGCTKPVFYNVTHSVHLAQSYFDAGIDGGTFQWYPTGLGFQKELKGNMLPNVDKYTIPFKDILKENKAARIVYEFDAADMLSTFMYPAMARTFRTAGMQLATHFSYDPTYLAPFNTEYNTHFMNLVYAPRKALSLMICAEVFRTIPLYSDYGAYPSNTTFGPFRVSYEDDLAEMLTDEKFIYTNHTNTKVKNPGSLKLIAGWGKSTLVEYDGTGAYFLDKVGDAIWRLEILPDVKVTDNLFGRNNNLTTPRAIINYQRRNIKINLAEFEEGYAIESIDWRDSMLFRETRGGYIDVLPGVYLLIAPKYQHEDSILIQVVDRMVLDEYFAPDEVSSTAVIAGVELPGSLPQNETILFNADIHFERLNYKWHDGMTFRQEGDNPKKLYLKLNGLTEVDEENPLAPLTGDFSMRHYFGDIINERVKEKKSLVFKGNGNYPLQLSLIMKDGSAFGGIIHLTNDDLDSTYILPLSELKRIQPVLLPRPYPTFLPYYSNAGISETLDMSEVESLQISIGPGIDKSQWESSFELWIESVELK